MFVGYSEISKACRVYVPGQREVEICHDVTYDEDASLKKVVNLPRSEEDHEARPGNQEEPKDETMPDVEGPMDPIDPPPSLGRDHYGSGTLSRMLRDIWPQGGHSVKARSRIDTKGI